MKQTTRLGWVFVILGTIFLLAGLYMLLTLSMPSGDSGISGEIAPPTISIWGQLMDFSLELLRLDWSARRIGIFIVLVGIGFEGAGTYLIMQDDKPKKRTSKKKR